jgi:hypothetical protein
MCVFVFALGAYVSVCVCVFVCAQGSLAPLVNSLAQAVREAGSALEEEGASSLGQAILSVVDSLAKKQ